MKRLAAVLLLAGLAQPPAVSADPRNGPSTPLPTAPRVPIPVVDPSGGVVPASGVSRVAAPTRERPTSLRNASTPTPGGQPLPTGFTAPAGYTMTGGGCAGPGCETPCEGSSRSCWSRLKAWLCFQPTTGDALPKLRPTPYVGPVVGTFPCTSAAACGTGNGCGPAGCAPGGVSGRFGPLLSGRGGRGECVPPADDAIAGYRFAPAQPAAVSVHPPAASASYKPAQAGPVQGAKPPADPLARPLTRP